MGSIILRLSTKENKSTGESEILIRFRHTGKVDIFTGSRIYIPSNRWNQDKREIIEPRAKKVKDPDQEKADAEIVRKRSQLSSLCQYLTDTFNALSKEDKSSVTTKWIENVIDKFYDPERVEKSNTLFSLMQSYIDSLDHRQLSKATKYHYKEVKSDIESFAKKEGVKDYAFTDLTDDFYQRFVWYLQHNGNATNTIGKKIKKLKSMLNSLSIADRSQIDLKKFVAPSEEVYSVALSVDELDKIKNAELDNACLERVRDWFLLLAWTGCRFSDLDKITRSDIDADFISFRQQKTGNKVTIPLHPVVKDILEKHNYKMEKSISVQKFNTYLKKVAKIAGIDTVVNIERVSGSERVETPTPKWDLISSHTGRRSFATNMYKMGIPTITIMAVTGHRTESAFLKYIKIDKEEHAKMMADAWRKLMQ